MDADDLNASDPARIAGLLDSNPSPRSAWSPDEIGLILRHQLASPVSDGLGLPSPSAPALQEVLLRSAGDVLRDPCPPVEVLEHMRRCAKRQRSDAASAVPPEVPTVLYYAAITAAMMRRGTRISDLDDGQLRDGLEWLVAQAWLDETTRALFAEGLAALPTAPPGAGGVADGRTAP
jgi:hypothetical protein